MDNKNTKTVDVAKEKGNGCLHPTPIIGGSISIKIEPKEDDEKNGD